MIQKFKYNTTKILSRFQGVMCAFSLFLLQIKKWEHSVFFQFSHTQGKKHKLLPFSLFTVVQLQCCNFRPWFLLLKILKMVPNRKVTVEEMG